MCNILYELCIVVHCCLICVLSILMHLSFEVFCESIVFHNHKEIFGLVFLYFLVSISYLFLFLRLSFLDSMI